MPRNEFGKVEFCTKSISNVTFGLSDFCLHQLWCKITLWQNSNSLAKLLHYKKIQIFTKKFES